MPPAPTQSAERYGVSRLFTTVPLTLTCQLSLCVFTPLVVNELTLSLAAVSWHRGLSSRQRAFGGC